MPPYLPAYSLLGPKAEPSAEPTTDIPSPIGFIAAPYLVTSLAAFKVLAVEPNKAEDFPSIEPVLAKFPNTVPPTVPNPVATPAPIPLANLESPKAEVIP